MPSLGINEHRQLTINKIFWFGEKQNSQSFVIWCVTTEQRKTYRLNINLQDLLKIQKHVVAITNPDEVVNDVFA